MAKLADALDLGSSVLDVQVQVLSSAPNNINPNLKPVGEGFGYFYDLKSIFVLKDRGFGKKSNPQPIKSCLI